MSRGITRDSQWMRAHCVSRPLLGMSRRFLNDRSDFHADCVSHRRPRKSGRRRLPRRSASHPQPHALRALVVRVGLPPEPARAPVTLSLTRFVTAHVLPISSPCMRAKPPTADATRARADHATSSRARTTRASRSRDLVRTTSAKQRRVNSRERRRSGRSAPAPAPSLRTAARSTRTPRPSARWKARGP